MEQVIYTASPLHAFGQDIMVAATSLVFAIMLVVMSRNKAASLLKRVGLGAGAIILLGICIITTAIAVPDFAAGPRQFVFTPGVKKVETRSTKNGQSYAYVVRAARPAQAAFYVPERIYNQIVLDGCYQFTYYGELSEGLTDPNDTVIEIRQLEPQRCAAGAGR